MVTNVAYLEHYIQFLEAQVNERFLYAADIPVECAVDVLQDLRFMGLTAATMFPGLDGAGRAIKHKMSFRRD